MGRVGGGGSSAAKRAFPSCYVPALVLLAAATVFQGGFYGEVAAPVSILLVPAALWMAFGMWRRPSPAGLLPLVLVGASVVFMAASAIAGGATYSKLAGLASWAVLPMGLLVGLLVSEAEVVPLVRGIAWVGAGCMAVTLLAYMGALPLDGFVNAARVQSFFQYANAAGIWFAAVALLAVASGDRALAATSPLMIACLLLTQSGGAILVSVLGWILFSVLAWRLDRTELALGLLSTLACAVVMAACALFVSPIALLPASVVCMAALYVLFGTDMSEAARKMLGALFLAVPIVAAVLLVLAMTLFPERVSRASQTFIERFIQMGDGARILVGSPLLGLGPDQWQFVYLREQGAQYTANVIHNGYLQATLDGGLVVGVLVVVGLVFAWLRALRSVVTKGDGVGVPDSAGVMQDVAFEDVRLAALCGSFMLLVHAFLDIDFRFASILLLLGLLLGVCLRGEAGKTAKGAEDPSLRISVGVATLMAIISVLSLFGTIVGGSLTASLAGGDSEMLGAFPSDALAVNDPGLQAAYLEGCYVSGSYDKAIDFANSHGAPSETHAEDDGVLPATGEQALALAQSYFGAGNSASAEGVLLRELALEPYNYQLFEQVAQLLREHDASEGALRAFNAQADKSNALLHTGTASLLRNTKAISKIA